MAVDVVDGLEMVEVEQEQRDLALFGDRTRDLALSRREQRPAIEEARQRVGVGEIARALLGFGTLEDFAIEILVAAPAEQDQRDIENHRRRQRAVGAAADADEGANGRLHHIAARPHEQQDRGDDNAPGYDVAFGALAAVEWLRRRCHMNLSHPYGLYGGKAVKFGLSAPPPGRARAYRGRRLLLTPLLRKGRRVRAHLAHGHIDVRDGKSVHG